MGLKRNHCQYHLILLVVLVMLAGGSLCSNSVCNSHSKQESSIDNQINLSSQVIENSTILVSEWIFVESGQELRIENSTLIFINDGLAIVVREGGVLTLRDTILYSHSDCSWWISGEQDSVLTLERCALEGSGTGTGGIDIKCDDALVSECHISGFGGYGIYIEDCSDVRILGNTISSCSRNGIAFARVSRLILSGNQISETGYCGIFGTGSVNATLINNTISNASFSGIGLDRTEQSAILSNCISETEHDSVSIEHCTDITVENNSMYMSYGCGILSIWSTQLYLGYNEINQTVCDGINLLTHSQDITVIGNSILNILSCGISSVSSSKILVSGNLIESTRHNGVHIVEASENITVTVNTIIDSATGLNLINASDVLVIGNWVNKSHYYDINVESSGNGLVYMNAFCSAGIQVASSSMNQFEWDNQTVGNFWVNHNGTDVDEDGIGDSPYVIDFDDYDRYPLMDLNPVIELRNSFSIPSGMWYETTNTIDSETANLTDSLEIYIIMNSLIKIVGVLAIITLLKRR